MPELDQKILEKLKDLIHFGDTVKQTGHDRGPMYLGYDYGVDYELAQQWGTSCLNLLHRVFGTDSVHYENFKTLYPNFHNYSPVVQALGVIRAAQDDYEQEFLFDTRVLIEAEVFDEFLEQAEYLLNSSYYQPAAVIIGSVLEDGLRKLCTRHEQPLSAKPKLDTMNSKLAKQGVYNKLTQKRITGLADIRNNAAHGKWSEFTKDDVEDMLRYVRQFMETYFS